MKLTRTEKARRFAAFCDNDDNFVVVKAGTPLWLEMKAQRAKNNARRAMLQAEAAAKSTTAASAFVIGETVQAPRMVIGKIVAIDGANVTLDNGRTFIASALRRV